MKNRLTRVIFVIVAVTLATVGMAACGGDLGNDADADVPTARGGDFSGTKWTFSNWPLYIDEKTVGDFDREFDVETEYVEDINDNNEFFSKMQPLFSAGKAGNRSAIVLSDWMLKKMFDLGYLQKIDHEALPNMTKNLVPALADEGVDPKQEYSVPYQAGMSGLIVDTEQAPDIHSINDLFDPKYKGRVGLQTEIVDTIPLVLAAQGVDPESASDEDWMSAIELLQKHVDSGQIRGFYGDDYISEFARGNLVGGIGWSGDTGMLEKDNPNLEWRMPQDGCVLWSSSFAIPVGAPNPKAALGFMNYVYQPKVAAQIAEYVQYMPTVDGVREILRKRDPELAANELMFPTKEFVSKCVPPVMPASDEVTRAYQRLMQG